MTQAEGLIKLEWWAVEVRDADGQIVTIETECLSGREIGPKEEATIKAAIEHLMAFSGVSPSALEQQATRIAELEAKLNVPEVNDFIDGVKLEAAHQRERWSSQHDAGKTDADWFWLVGYLAGKALHNPPNEMLSDEAQRHRIITVAAACANWHAAKLGNNSMRPGIDPEERGVA